MVAAVRVHKTWRARSPHLRGDRDPAPGQGQIKLKQHACGVNYIDTYFRMGMYPSPVGLPFVSGNEGAGEVIAVGPGVTDLKVGDRVAYVCAGRLCGGAADAGRPRVKLPTASPTSRPPRMMLKGMTAQYLLRRTYKVKKGDTILVHAAAGGVGQILCQWGNASRRQRDRHGRLRRTRARSPRPTAAHHIIHLPQGGFRRAGEGDHRRQALRCGV